MDEAQSPQTNRPLTKNLTDLLADAINLATYAVENGRMPGSVCFSDLYRMWDKMVEQGQKLTDEDVDKLQFCYQILEAELAPVSVISLKATDTSGASKRKDYLNTEAGKHAKRMWFVAFAILGLIFGINLYQYTFDMNSADWALNYTDSFGNLTILYWLTGTITPFAYGAFGATVRLLRITEQRLRDRSFDPRLLAEHLNRLVLGTLSGGVVVLISSSGGIGDMDVKLTQAALGFLAGYSIDLMFSLIDRMVKAISPGEESASAMSRVEKPVPQKLPQTFAKRETEKTTPVVSATSSSSATGATDQNINTSSMAHLSAGQKNKPPKPTSIS